MFNTYPYTDFHEMNLDWFLMQFKELVDDWETFKNDLTAQWEQVSQDWQTLYNYVHDYFDNLDVQEEIDNKLNEMVANGSLLTIIQPTIIDAAGNWLEENLTPTSPPVDQSLTISGAAADAKVTGDRLNALNKDLNDNLDLIFTDLFNIGEYRTISWIQGGINASGVPNTSSIRIRSPYITTHKPYKIYVPEGYKIRIGYYTNEEASAFVYWDDWQTESFDLYSGYDYVWRAIVGKTDESDIVPDDGANILFAQIDSVDYANEDYVDTEVNAIYNDIATQKQISIINSSNRYYWNVETDVAVKTYVEATFFASDPIAVKEGEKFILEGARQGVTDKARPWVITDDDYNIISMSDNYHDTTERTLNIVVPVGGTKLLLTNQGTVSNQKLYKYILKTDLLMYPIEGKYLSILGDSISAYAGTIPEGNDAYYTGSNSGVTSPDQMWWKILCDETGMIPLIINGYSGSGVTQLEDSAHINKVAMSSDSRCSELNDGTIMPDIILIAGGVNDYTYALSAQSEPLDWDATTAPVITNSFTEAYACMIKKLQTNYPNAIIVALSTWFTMRGTDNGYTLTHTIGSNVYTQQDYNDKVRYVAEQMHIPYIDVSNIGFNRNNFYPTYAQDSATIPTHPNAAGHAVMGKAIAKKLPELVSGFVN